MSVTKLSNIKERRPALTAKSPKRELCMNVVSNWYGEISQELENEMAQSAAESQMKSTKNN